jgi:hypothetical protein
MKYAAVSGNIVFVFWILFNAMEEGFKGTLPEKASFFGIIGLLLLNSILLLNKPIAAQFSNQPKNN